MTDKSNDNLKISPLYKEHIAMGARMVPFAGWNMPVQYSGVVDEHKTVRSGVGIFDVSHMGEFNVMGRGAADFLQKMTINDISKLKMGQAQYNAFCNSEGGVIDDILIYKRGFDSFFLCVNAVNIEKDFNWLKKNIPTKGVLLEDVSQEYAQLAIQGPKSRDLLSSLVDIKISELNYYHFVEGKVLGVPSIIARTGYTGELGFELYFPITAAVKVWRGAMQTGEQYGIKPCGLGARDTLRLEIGYLLYGNDMDENFTPMECGLSWITKLNKDHFIGKEKLLQQKEMGVEKKLAAFEMLDKTIARSGYKVYSAEDAIEPIGNVTSGSPSPSLGKNIGMAYVKNNYSNIGSKIWVEIRGIKKPANIVKKPFFINGTVQN